MRLYQWQSQGCRPEEAWIENLGTQWGELEKMGQHLSAGHFVLCQVIVCCNKYFINTFQVILLGTKGMEVNSTKYNCNYRKLCKSQIPGGLLSLPTDTGQLQKGDIWIQFRTIAWTDSAKLSPRGKLTGLTTAMLTWDVIPEIHRMFNPGLRDYSSFSQVSNMWHRQVSKAQMANKDNWSHASFNSMPWAEHNLSQYHEAFSGVEF